MSTAPIPVHDPPCEPDDEETLIDSAAEAYLAFADLFEPSARPADRAELAALAETAWAPLADELATTAEMLGQLDEHGARRAEGMASGWLARLREIAPIGDRGSALWDVAFRAALWKGIAARRAGARPTLIAGLAPERFLRDLPQRPAAILARLFLEAGDHRNARRFAQQTSPSDPLELAVRMEVALGTTDEPAAAATLEALARAGVGERTIQQLRGRLAMMVAKERGAAGDASAALAILEHAMAGNATPEPALQLAYGVALRAAGRPCEALAELAAASAAGPQVLLELGHTRLRMGDAEAALAFFQAAAEHPEASEHAALGMAETERALGHLRESADSLLRGLPDRDRSVAVMARAVALSDEGEGGRAARLLIDASPPPQQRSRWLCELGRAFRLAGNLESARGCLDQALADPGAGFPEVLEHVLLSAVEGSAPEGVAERLEAHAARALRAQDYYHITSWRGEEDARARAALSALLSFLETAEVPLAVVFDQGRCRARFHLAADRMLAPLAQPGALLQMV